MENHNERFALEALERAADKAGADLFAALENTARVILRANPGLSQIDAAQGLEFVTLDGERRDLATDCPDALEPLRKALDIWDAASPGTSPGLVMTQADALESEPEGFPAFIADMGLEMDARPVAARPVIGKADSWGADSLHFQVTIHRSPAGFNPGRAPVVVWTGFYSVGAAWPGIWARNGCKTKTRAGRDSVARNAWNRIDGKTRAGNFPGSRMSLHDSGLWETVRERFHNAAPLDLADILESLQMDSSDWESTFDDWADSLGYDNDSKSAESVFRACQDTAKTLRAAFGPENFNRFLNLEA